MCIHRFFPLSLLAFFCLTAGALAQEGPSESSKERKRWSIEAGVKMLLLEYQVRVNYRLPVLEDHWSLYASYAPLTAEYTAFPGRFHTAMFGTRYYPVSADTPWSTLYLTGAIVGTINPTGAANPFANPDNSAQRDPDLVSAYLGMGADYMFNENWGINGQLGGLFFPSSFFIPLPQAELNLKYAF